MKEQIISLETAQIAKEAGFDWKVRDIWEPHEHGNKDLGPILKYLSPENYNLGLWGKDKVSAPSQSLLQRWLREHDQKKQIVLIDCCINSLNSGYEWRFSITSSPYPTNSKQSHYQYDNYEEALEEGLQEALKLMNS